MVGAAAALSWAQHVLDMAHPPQSLLAARPDLLPKPYLDALSELQDRLPSFPSSIAFEVGLQGNNAVHVVCGPVLFSTRYTCKGVL